MKNANQNSTIASRVARYWAKFCHQIGATPPPWHRETMVDTIDLGQRLMADVRVFTNDEGNECFLIDVMDKQHQFHTVALFQCCDISATISLLLESQLVIQRYKNSVPADEWCDD